MQAGLSKEQIARGGYLIKTTLDPEGAGQVKESVDSIASPTLQGIASIMNIVLPGKTSHPVIAMVSNRTYGLDTGTGRPFSHNPSRWSATGRGRSSRSSPPRRPRPRPGHQRRAGRTRRFEARGLGAGGAGVAPRETWCVENYRDPRYLRMNVTEALSGVPEHRVREAHLRRSALPAPSTWRSGWGCGPTPSPVARAATTRKATKAWPISSSGRTSARSPWARSRSIRSNWPTSRQPCPPAECGVHPTRSTRSTTGAGTDLGQRRGLRTGGPGGARQHPVNAMSRDTINGTAAPRRKLGGLEPTDVGQDRHHRGPPVVGLPGLHQPLRRSQLHLRRFPDPSDLCSFPLRPADGNLFGGNEPAETWFTAINPIAGDFGEVSMPPTDPATSTAPPVHGFPTSAGSARTAREKSCAPRDSR